MEWNCPEPRNDRLGDENIAKSGSPNGHPDSKRVYGCDKGRNSGNAADSRALIVDICQLAGRAPVASVLICDDRPAVRRYLTDILRPLPAPLSITAVSDGFALVEAHHAEPADVILIGFHDLGDTAERAMSLILRMDPSAIVIIVGSVDDAERLVDAFVHGARGLLLWD